MGAGAEGSFVWITCFRRLVEDHERDASTPADLHGAAFVCQRLRQAAQRAGDS